ncbi:hypothetical protein EV356DRAFT_566891 [Viridothelium virens]|uniref:Uncharacterized protein n=1 Tax=Viridothelium virens TaxID=1048519 RepID=A0A6A6H9D0_VIRVR|nr:hypothetical protein EV356DRAFT_566891 [Viridothelium virens]
MRHFLRSVGLNAFNRTHSRSIQDTHMTVFVYSRWVALQICMVHLLPCLVSITVITLNVEGFFVGATVGSSKNGLNLVLLQVVAKLQEILIVASMATLIFHVMRLKLLRKDGINFGLLGGGFMFSQISYFWSAEFIAALSTPGDKWLILLLIVGGLIAVSAGPATAVLLVPSEIDYHAGSAKYYLNGSTETFWPSKLTLDHYLPLFNNSINETVNCASNEGYKSAVCPTGGYLALANHFSAVTRLNVAGSAVSSDYGFTVTRGSQLFGMSVTSPLGQVAEMQITPVRYRHNSSEISLLTAHGATINIQQRLDFAWQHAIAQANSFAAFGNGRLQYSASQFSVVQSQIPIVRAVCQGQLLNANESSVDLPVIPARGSALGPTQDVLELQKIRLSTSSNSRMSDRPSLRWLDIAPFINGNSSISMSAAATVEVFSSENDSTLAAACSIDARWAEALVWSEFPRAFQGYPSAGGQWSTQDTNYERADRLFEGDFSMRKIHLDSAFLDAINFQVPTTAPMGSPQGISALEALISLAGVPIQASDWIRPRNSTDSLPWLENVIASTLIDAIARTGSYRTYDTSGPIASWPFVFYNPSAETFDINRWNQGVVIPPNLEDVTEMHVRHIVTGYGYQFGGDTSQYLSIAVLLSHLFLALAHTIYMLILNPRSSDCWDTVLEWIALALQSPPSGALQDTWAGIRRSAIFRNSVRVRSPYRWGGRSLELVVSDKSVPDVDLDRYTG